MANPQRFKKPSRVPLRGPPRIRSGQNQRRKGTSPPGRSPPRDRVGQVKIIGTSPPMVGLLHLVKTIGPKDVKVLIRGERGTGKELVADAIHSLSHRNKRPFIKINCAVLGRDLLASELFGHVKGAFTGATSTRVGLIPAADTGTIFLDEIGDLCQNAQGSILRFLQDGEVRPIGSLHAINVDVRVIAATNKNLDKAMEKGTFREDLYDRLNEFSLEVPPLRERTGDIPHLIAHFIAKYNRRHGEDVKRFSKDAMDFLQQYPWPGNVRELENVVSRGVILSQGKRIIGLNQIRDILPHNLPATALAQARRAGLPDSVPASGSYEPMARREGTTPRRARARAPSASPAGLASPPASPERKRWRPGESVAARPPRPSSASPQADAGRDALNPTQEAILNIARSKQTITSKDLRVFNISDRAIRKHLTSMIQAGLLKAEGTNKTRRYVLSQPYRNPPNSLNVP
ncbi:MAG: sigma 54-interacting transcriptional regulator [Desulfobacterales bacterium]|nr:sigma 54-interacting transcriptional regulator [Desulfobacterales bacterium]